MTDMAALGIILEALDAIRHEIRAAGAGEKEAGFRSMQTKLSNERMASAKQAYIDLGQGILDTAWSKKEVHDDG